MKRSDLTALEDLEAARSSSPMEGPMKTNEPNLAVSYLFGEQFVWTFKHLGTRRHITNSDHLSLSSLCGVHVHSWNEWYGRSADLTTKSMLSKVEPCRSCLAMWYRVSAK